MNKCINRIEKINHFSFLSICDFIHMPHLPDYQFSLIFIIFYFIVCCWCGQLIAATNEVQAEMKEVKVVSIVSNVNAATDVGIKEKEAGRRSYEHAQLFAAFSNSYVARYVTMATTETTQRTEMQRLISLVPESHRHTSSPAMNEQINQQKWSWSNISFQIWSSLGQ